MRSLKYCGARYGHGLRRHSRGRHMRLGWCNRNGAMLLKFPSITTQGNPAERFSSSDMKLTVFPSVEKTFD